MNEEIGRRHDDDDSDLWSSISDLFGAMTLIFLVLFLLAAALVGDRTVTTVREELVELKRKNIVLLDEIERLEKELDRRRTETEKYKKTAESVVSLSAVVWAVVMKADVADPATARYELMVLDPIGGRISDSIDESFILSNRGASWVSVGAEQIIAQDADRLDTDAIYPGTYKVLVVYQKGNEETDRVTFQLGKRTSSGGMEELHKIVLSFDQLQPLEESLRVFQFEVDSSGGISNIRNY